MVQFRNSSGSPPCSHRIHPWLKRIAIQSTFSGPFLRTLLRPALIYSFVLTQLLIVHTAIPSEHFRVPPLHEFNDGYSGSSPPILFEFLPPDDREYETVLSVYPDRTLTTHAVKYSHKRYHQYTLTVEKGDRTEIPITLPFNFNHHIHTYSDIEITQAVLNRQYHILAMASNTDQAVLCNLKSNQFSRSETRCVNTRINYGTIRQVEFSHDGQSLLYLHHNLEHRSYPPIQKIVLFKPDGKGFKSTNRAVSECNANAPLHSHFNPDQPGQLFTFCGSAIHRKTFKLSYDSRKAHIVSFDGAQAADTNGLHVLKAAVLHNGLLLVDAEETPDGAEPYSEVSSTPAGSNVSPTTSVENETTTVLSEFTTHEVQKELNRTLYLWDLNQNELSDSGGNRSTLMTMTDDHFHYEVHPTLNVVLTHQHSLLRLIELGPHLSYRELAAYPNIDKPIRKVVFDTGNKLQFLVAYDQGLDLFYKVKSKTTEDEPLRQISLLEQPVESLALSQKGLIAVGIKGNVYIWSLEKLVDTLLRQESDVPEYQPIDRETAPAAQDQITQLANNETSLLADPGVLSDSDSISSLDELIEQNNYLDEAFRTSVRQLSNSLNLETHGLIQRLMENLVKLQRKSPEN